MILKDIFTSFFFEDQLDIDNEPIIKFCENNIDEKTENCSFVSFEQKEFQELGNLVYDRVKEAHKQIGLSDKYEPYIWRYWANRDVNHNISSPHSHPDAFFSCVYYAKALPKSGQLHFMTPAVQMLPILKTEMIDKYTNYNSHSWFVDPTPGKLFIFPSWIWHFVAENKSQHDRISIAFDTKVRLKKLSD